jgi:AcrR family transcriptional regulator
VTDLADRIDPVEGVPTAAMPAADAVDDGRPTKGERTRRRILELAVDRFGSRGFRGTSVSEIARSAGLTQAAAYAYFDNKEALFRAAVDADADGLVDEVSAQVDGVDIHQLIPSIVVLTVAALPTHPLVRRVLAGQEPDEVPRLVELPALRRFGDIVRDRLQQAQQTGQIRADFTPEVLAAGVESLVLGLLFTTVQTQGAATPRHVDGVVEAFDLMLRPSA